MDQEMTINKVLRDLKQFGLISEDDCGLVRRHLNYLYVAAWEARSHDTFGKHKERPIEQLNRKGEKINEYDSTLKAAKAIKCSDRAIFRALKSGKKTRSGYFWRYK